MKQRLPILTLVFTLGAFVSTSSFAKANRYTVVGDDEKAIEKALSSVGGKKEKSYQHLKGVATYLSQGQAKQLEEMLGENGKVIRDEFFQAIPPMEAEIQGKPSGGGGGTPAQVVPWGVSAVRAPQAWAYARGAGAIVCVVDSGIDMDHPDLAANILIGANYIDGTTWDDGNGHGTHVAGTIAALDNTIGVVGIAPEAKLIASRVLDNRGNGTCGDMADGILGCLDLRDQVDPGHLNGLVINMSFNSNCAGWELVEAATQTANAAGAFQAAAAGNYSFYSFIRPAVFANVHPATAVNQDLTFASFSNWGFVPGVHEGWTAPGNNILSLWKGGGTRTDSGTSMSTAHVSGVAALMYSAQSLGVGAIDIGLPYEQQGFGLVDALTTVLNH